MLIKMTEMARPNEKGTPVNKETVVEIQPRKGLCTSLECFKPRTKEDAEMVASTNHGRLDNDIIWLLAASLIVLDLYIKLLVEMLTPKGDTWADYTPLYCMLGALCLALFFCYAAIKWGESGKTNPDLVKENLIRFKAATAVIGVTLLMYCEPPLPLYTMSGPSAPWVGGAKRVVLAPAAAGALALWLRPPAACRAICRLAAILGLYYAVQLALTLVEYADFGSRKPSYELFNLND